MTLHIALTMPNEKVVCRWLKITQTRSRCDDGSLKIIVSAKLRWWWKLALYSRLLRTAKVRIAQ